MRKKRHDSTLRWVHPTEQKKDLRFISRCEYTRSKGWWVRIERKGFRRRKFFGDGSCGSRSTALQLALNYRDDELRRAPAPLERRGLPPGPGRIFREQRSYKTPNGAVVRYTAWSAWIRMAPRRSAATSYGVLKWGEAIARAKAEKWLRMKRRERKNLAIAMSAWPSLYARRSA